MVDYKRAKFFMGIVTAACLLLACGFNSFAAKGTAAAMSEGEKLERQMWADIKAKKWPAVMDRLAMGFQSVYADGVRDYKQEVGLLKSLNPGKIGLSGFYVTEKGPVIVVTYRISVEETIDGKRVSVKDAPRQSVWLRTENGWKWIAHANLNQPSQ